MNILEKIEDEYDLECYKKAVEEYRKNPKTYTMEEVKEELKLKWNITIICQKSPSTVTHIIIN